ncbi:MAG: hypothetical protein ACSLEN_14725 [Candidatus Malihini olakiniferum]
MTEWRRQGYITYSASYITLCNLDCLRVLAAKAQRPF